MFILLHSLIRPTDPQIGNEIVINTDKISCMTPARPKGTVLRMEPYETWITVEESISDIYARMRKE